MGGEGGGFISHQKNIVVNLLKSMHIKKICNIFIFLMREGGVKGSLDFSKKHKFW